MKRESANTETMLDSMSHDAAMESLDDEEVARANFEHFGIHEERSISRLQAHLASLIAMRKRELEG